jgi:hypothetical protein
MESAIGSTSCKEDGKSLIVPDSEVNRPSESCRGLSRQPGTLLNVSLSETHQAQEQLAESQLSNIAKYPQQLSIKYNPLQVEIVQYSRYVKRLAPT